MFHFVIGFPGRFAQACSVAVLSKVQRNGGWPNVIAVDTPEQVTRAILESGNRDTVLLASHPGGRIRRALAEARRPFLVAMDDPRRVIADLVLNMNMDLATAVRMTASACPSVLGYADIECAIVVRASDPPAQTAATLARYLGWVPGDPTIAALMNGLRQRSMVDVESWWASLDSAGSALAEGAIAAYLVPGRKPSKALRWDEGLFLTGNSGPSSVGPINITGRKRVLLEGPGIQVAHGTWHLVLTMEFSRVAADYDYRLDVVAGNVLATLNFHPPGDGEQRSVLDFHVPDTIDYPLSIRLSLQRAAFDGTVTLKSAVLHPLPA